MNALKKEKFAIYLNGAILPAAILLGKGEGRHATPPRTYARFASLAEIFGSRRFFFAAYFPHCGAWSQAKRPRTQTEYRKSKGGKDRPD